MTKYCKNWELFELSHPLQGEGQPQYLGRFEIEDVTEFLSSEMPTEMKSALEKYGAIFKDGKQWIGQLIATNC